MIFLMKIILFLYKFRWLLDENLPQIIKETENWLINIETIEIIIQILLVGKLKSAPFNYLGEHYYGK